MKPRLLLLAIMADRFANLEESNLAFLLDQKNSENTKKAQKLLIERGSFSVLWQAAFWLCKLGT